MLIIVTHEPAARGVKRLGERAIDADDCSGQLFSQVGVGLEPGHVYRRESRPSCYRL